MKKILFFMFVALALTFVSCGDDDYAVDEAYEKAEITNVTVYNRAARSNPRNSSHRPHPNIAGC